MRAIRIVEVPPGEAPAEIRQAWVGLVLPLPTDHVGPKRFPVAGVVSGPKSLLVFLWRRLTSQLSYMEGYQVRALPAIEILAKADPAAAGWWRQNTPHLMRRWAGLVFPAHCCELVRDPCR